MSFDRQLVTGIPDRITAKWSGEVLRDGLVPFPKRLPRCLGSISHGSNAVEDLRIVLAVADYLRPNLTAPPSLEFLGFTAGLRVEDVRAGLERLRHAGLETTSGDEGAMTISLAPLLEKIIRETSDKAS